MRTFQIYHRIFLIKVRILRIMTKSEIIIEAIKEHYGLKNDAEFARFMDKSPTTVSSWKSRGSIDDKLIYAKCVGISADFLQTGSGVAFPKKKEMTVISDDEPRFQIRNSSSNEKKIPLYDNIHTVGGVKSIANVQDAFMPTEWIDAGDWFPGATAAIRHYGDSMIEYTSGSILVLKEVVDLRMIVWGRNYVIETTEYRITKQLQDGDPGKLIGYSSNLEAYPDGRQIHAPIHIPIETIRTIYQVIGCVINEYPSSVIKLKK